MGGERVERRLAAILAADVAGYSRLMGQDEAGTLQRLKALRGELVDPKIAEHKGRIVKTTGDGLLIEFPSVVEAVACAAAVQRDIAEQNASVPAAERLVFRVGINLGDVIIDGEDIHGDGVNIAARLEGLAEPGGICVSAVVYDQVRGRVDCPFEDLGEQTLKNISRPLRLYRVVRNSAARATGDVATKAAVHNNELPLPNKPSIAVLPLQNMSGDPEQVYFVDGMVEEIITALSRIRWLFVIARNSSFTYKGQSIDVKQVGRELGVRYVLEGSVRKSGERVRITAQLIDAETGAHLWAERYDQTLEDVFAVQEEVTRSIVAAVAPEVELAEIAHAGRFTANNAVAQLTWRAQGLFYEALQKGQPPLMTEAIGTAQRAIAIDAGRISTARNAQAHRPFAGACARRRFAGRRRSVGLRRPVSTRAASVLAATHAVIVAFGSALMRYESGSPDQCPKCGSYSVAVEYNPEASPQYVSACEKCDWESEATVSGPKEN